MPGIANQLAYSVQSPAPANRALCKRGSIRDTIADQIPFATQQRNLYASRFRLGSLVFIHARWFLAGRVTSLHLDQHHTWHAAMSILTFFASLIPTFVWNILESLMMNVVAPIFMPVSPKPWHSTRGVQTSRLSALGPQSTKRCHTVVACLCLETLSNLPMPGCGTSANRFVTPLARHASFALRWQHSKAGS